MEVERRALYNLLRMSWRLDPKIQVEPWQIADYRSLTTQQLFALLNQHGIRIDQASFMAFAEENDTPEEFAEALRPDELDPKSQDKLYLIIFELWRRLKPEKPSLSILCDELDHQLIHMTKKRSRVLNPLKCVLANLLEVLNENVDQGIKPKQAFKFVSEGCAHNVEDFLYDFISELLDDGNYSFAGELFEGFGQYVEKSDGLNC